MKRPVIDYFKDFLGDTAMFGRLVDDLEALGYDVTLATDTTREGMSKAFFR